MSDSEEDDFELYDTTCYYQIPEEKSSRETSYIYDDGIGKLYEKLVGQDRLRTEDEFSDDPEDVLENSFDDEIYSDQLVTKRDYAIKEIVDTEKRYFNQLSAIIDQFLKPLNKVIDKSKIKSIFANIQDIHAVHENLLYELENISSQRFETRTFSKPFIYKRDALFIYAEYLVNTDHAKVILEEIIQNNRLAGAIVSQGLDFWTSQYPDMPLELKELLLLPMQRVLRYPLIIENLIKCSGKNHPDHNQLLAALDGMRDLNMHINQTKADMEDTIKPLQKLEKLIGNSKMKNIFPPIDSLGKLICYSKAYKWGTAVNVNTVSRQESCDRDAIDGIHVMVLTNFLIAFKLQLVNRSGIIFFELQFFSQWWTKLCHLKLCIGTLHFNLPDFDHVISFFIVSIIKRNLGRIRKIKMTSFGLRYSCVDLSKNHFPKDSSREKIDKIIFLKPISEIKVDPELKEKKILGMKRAVRLTVSAGTYTDKIYFRPRNLNMATNLLSKIEYAQDRHLRGYCKNLCAYIPSDVPIQNGVVPKCDRMSCRKLFHGIRMQGYKCISRNIFIHEKCLKLVMYDDEPVQECEITETSHYGVYADLENSFDTSFGSPAPLRHQPYYKSDFDRTDAIHLLKKYKNGAFIIRVRKENDRFPYAISINSNGKILHAKIAETQNGRFHIDGKESFESIVEMIDYYKANGIKNRIAGFSGDLKAPSH